MPLRNDLGRITIALPHDRHLLLFREPALAHAALRFGGRLSNIPWPEKWGAGQFGGVLHSGLSRNELVSGSQFDDTLLGGAGDDRINGDSLSGDLVLGPIGHDVLDGGEGNDTLDGVWGNDTLLGGAGNDNLYGNEGDDMLNGGSGDDDLEGGDGDDQMFGTDGHDTLIGGGGDDTLNGGDGNDTIEDNFGNNRLIGGAGDDSIHGGVGNDTIVAGAGDDTIRTVGFGGSIIYGGDGNDTIFFGAEYEGSDSIFGGAGDDIFISAGGGTGAVLRGGTGWDMLTNLTLELYQLDIAGIEELQSDGTTFIASVEQLKSFKTISSEDGNISAILSGAGGAIDFSGKWSGVTTGTVIADDVESGVRLTGGDTKDIFSGSGFDDVLIGGAGDDHLFGDAPRSPGTIPETISNDILWGGAGNDELYGGGGNDKLYGGDGNDLLGGGAGVDSMTGGAGDDTYVVDQRDDVIVEAAGAGADTVRSFVSWTLGDNLEHLELTGTRATFGDGNALDNTLTGNRAGNTLSGKDGDDTLAGKGGADQLWGGAGVDRFVFDTALGPDNIDRVRDFAAGEDTIVLDHAVFGALTPGGLAASAFQSGSAVAASSTARILHDTATGALYYDADGTGSAVAQQFATIKAGLTLSTDDFNVV